VKGKGRGGDTKEQEELGKKTGKKKSRSQNPGMLGRDLMDEGKDKKTSGGGRGTNVRRDSKWID